MSSGVIVVGSGVYGAAVSAALAEKGAHVVVVDSGMPAGGTSGATFSWTNSCGKQPFAYHELSVAAMAAHRRLAREAVGSDWYYERGNVEWVPDDQVQRDRLAQKVRGLLEYGYEVEWLTRAQLLRLEPDMDAEKIPDDAIAFYPDEGWIEPARLVGYLLAKAKSNGGRLVTNDGVQAVEIAGNRISAVVLRSGARIAADAMVNCAGPNASAVARMAGADLPMRNTRGVLVYTGPTSVTVNRVIHSPEVHLRPDGGGRVLLHTHDIDSAASVDGDGNVVVDPCGHEQVVTAAGELYPGLVGVAVESVRVGERPIPQDGLPVLGRVLDLDNLFVAVSHSGATLSVHAGALVAAEVMGEPQDEALSAFRFERLAS